MGSKNTGEHSNRKTPPTQGVRCPSVPVKKDNVASRMPSVPKGAPKK